MLRNGKILLVYLHSGLPIFSHCPYRTQKEVEALKQRSDSVKQPFPVFRSSSFRASGIRRTRAFLISEAIASSWRFVGFFSDSLREWYFELNSAYY